MATTIEWTEETWNPVTGCDKVSRGCAHCYAETVALRFWKDRPFTAVQCHEDRLYQPLRWKRPRRIFVNSMSDLFHEAVPFEFVAAVFGVMAAAPHHTFQILTKRPERMRAFFAWLDFRCQHDGDFTLSHWEIIEPDTFPATATDAEWPLPNVWLGVSVENQHFADERIPLLLKTPAAVRFISAEPLLGPINLRDEMAHVDDYFLDALDTPDPTRRLDWVIVGGESGPKARPFDVCWARSIVQQCQTAGVPVFVKQLGARPFGSCRPEGCGLEPHEMRFNDRKGGDPAEWPEDLRVRQFPGVEGVTA